MRIDEILGKSTIICLAFLGCLAMPPAFAQVRTNTVMEIGGVRLSVTKDELRALSDVGNLLGGRSVARLDRALAEARRVVRGRDALHVLALYELEISAQRGDSALREQALNVLIDSPLTQSDKLPAYLGMRGQIAYAAGDPETALKDWTRWAELAPYDPQAFANLAQAQLARDDFGSALTSIARAIALGSDIDPDTVETWYQQRLSIGQRTQSVEIGFDAAHALVRAYPTRSNWRNAMVVYRQLAKPEGNEEIDLLRFMREASLLTRADEFKRMAQLLHRTGEDEEANTVIGDGVRKGMVDVNDPSTRDIMVELSRPFAGNGRTTIDAKATSDARDVQDAWSLVRMRQEDQASALLRQVIDREEDLFYSRLASFWLAWLDGRGSFSGPEDTIERNR